MSDRLNVFHDEHGFFFDWQQSSISAKVTLIFRTPDLNRICELPFAALIFITADIAAYNEDDMMSQYQHVERFNQMTNHVTTSSNVTSRISLIYPDIKCNDGESHM